jgi:hypothetical protein
MPSQSDSTGQHDGPALLLPCPAGLRSRGKKNAQQVGQYRRVHGLWGAEVKAGRRYVLLE